MTDNGFPQYAASLWSVLLIAGASGCGKSTVAREISRASGATWIQVDDLRLALQSSNVCLPSDEATEALYFFERTPGIWNLPAERLQEGLVAVGEAMADAVAIVTGNHVVQGDPAVIEGDGILPELIDRPEIAEFVASGQVEMVVLDPPNEEWLLANMIERGRGVSDRSEIETRTIGRASWLHAKWLKREAEARAVSVIPCLPWETLPERIDSALGSEHDNRR